MEKEGEKFFKFCPRCGSVNVKLTDRPAFVAYKELYVRCVDCGLSAKEFPEGTLEFIKDFKKKISKKKTKKNSKQKKGRKK